MARRIRAGFPNRQAGCRCPRQGEVKGMDWLVPDALVRIRRASCAPLLGQLGRVESVDESSLVVEYAVKVLTGEFAGRPWTWWDEKDRLSIEPEEHGLAQMPTAS